MKKSWLCVWALAAGVASADVTITENTTLAADADWREQGTLVVAEGVTLDLAGHVLRVAGLAGAGTIDSVAVPSFKYYRFKVENTRGSFFQISELKLYNGETEITGDRTGFTYDSTTKTDGTGGVGADLTTPGGETQEKLVDGDTATKWLDFRSHPSNSQTIRDAAWVTLEFAAPTPVTRYEWYTGNDTGNNPDRNPTAWRFQGSNDNATWTDLDVQSDRTDLTTQGQALAYAGTPALANGVLHVDVPAGTTSENATVTLAGTLKLVKDGEGEFVVRKGGQTYVGGTEVAAGTLALAMSSDANEYSPVRLLTPFGGGNQAVLVLPGATFDPKGNYDTFLFHTTLAGGTIANHAKDMVNPGYGIGAPYALTQDSFADFTHTYAWGDVDCDLGGHTLTMRLADDKYFYLARRLLNGRVVLGNDANQKGRFVTYRETDCSTVDFDIAANFEIKQDLKVRSLVTRQPGAWGWNATDKKIRVLGTFKPVTDYFPNVELQASAVLDLTDRTEAWAIESRDFPGQDTTGEPYRCSFADGATIVIDVRGRTLAMGAQLVAWETMPANFATLTFLINDGSEELVAAAAAGPGLFYGADPTSTEVATARWTGAVNADFANPGNWACLNAAGVTVPEVCPSADSFVTLAGTISIQLPANAGFVCKGFKFDDCTLAADSDLSGVVAVLDGQATIDLAGHALTLGGFTGLGTLVDSVGGGSLHVTVPEGAQVANTGAKLEGGFPLVKEGAGTFVATKGGQAYTGGTRVAAGTVKAGAGDALRPFGPRGAEISVDAGATFDSDGKAFGSIYTLVGNGGRLVLASTGALEAPRFEAFQLNGAANLVAPNELQLTKNEGNSIGSAYWKQRVNAAAPWRATFTYKTVGPNNPADGFAFVLHNAPLTTIGGTGGNFAVNNVTPSVGTAYNIYNGDSAGFVVDGGRYDMNGNLNGVAIDQGVDVVVEYDGNGMLTQTLTRDGVSVSFSRAVDIGAQLGPTAYVGFTGACGGASCDQRIVDFTFTSVEPGVVDVTPTATGWQSTMTGGLIQRGNGRKMAESPVK